MILTQVWREEALVVKPQQFPEGRHVPGISQGLVTSETCTSFEISLDSQVVCAMKDAVNVGLPLFHLAELGRLRIRCTQILCPCLVQKLLFPGCSPALSKRSEPWAGARGRKLHPLQGCSNFLSFSGARGAQWRNCEVSEKFPHALVWRALWCPI